MKRVPIIAMMALLCCCVALLIGFANAQSQLDRSFRREKTALDGWADALAAGKSLRGSFDQCMTLLDQAKRR